MYNIVAAGAAELGAGVTIVTEYLAAIGDPIVADVVHEEVQRHTAEPRHALLLAHIDGELAGCVEVHPLEHPENFENKAPLRPFCISAPRASARSHARC